MANPPPADLPAGLAGARALDAGRYVGRQALDRDLDRVFARNWQLVSHVRQLVDPGDHVVATVGRTPLLVLRGEDGALRALANVCRHRAGPLALHAGRAARAFRCRYHGWSYDLEGRLRHAPEMESARDFCVEEVQLPRFAAAEWQGLVFASLVADAPALGQRLSGIAQRIAPIDIAGMSFAHRDTYELACDWKVYVDNYLEGYHLPCVHPGLSRLLDYRAYRTELFPAYSLQHSPLSVADGPYGRGDAYYYFVYPNLMLNILPGRLQLNRVLPTRPGHCIVEFDYYYAPGEESRLAPDREFSDEVQREDTAICEAVQRGLASRHYEAGCLNPRRESGLWHFHRLLRRDYSHEPGGPRHEAG